MTTAPLSNDARAIEELRSKLGGRLTIVGHHYEQGGSGFDLFF